MKFLLLILLLLNLHLIADEKMLQASSYKTVQINIGKGKATFLEVGSEYCHSCQTMGKMLYKVTQKYPKYNIHFINVQEERDAAKALKIMMIPTQIIYDKKGKEVYRHIGVLSGDDLTKLFHTYSF